MTRRQAREKAFALLFEKSFNSDVSMRDIIDFALSERLMAIDSFSSSIALKAWENIFEIDDLIEKNAIGWKKSRISKVTLAILRLAICELLFFDEIPVSVSINEAVELCKIYADEADASFVNGILGSISKSKSFEKTKLAESE
ncbi:MAG: transcription antitermination factor NusB [Clostridiales bacterium]|jgi:N utilization substance protein B|nr:transcription antitermination factor NusB [Clostridiales bacterium]